MITKVVERNGRYYVVKIIMTSVGGAENGYCFSKIDLFVNFKYTKIDSQLQLVKQIARKVEFYEKLYEIKIVDYSYNIMVEEEMVLQVPIWEKGGKINA